MKYLITILAMCVAVACATSFTDCGKINYSCGPKQTKGLENEVFIALFVYQDCSYEGLKYIIFNGIF